MPQSLTLPKHSHPLLDTASLYSFFLPLSSYRMRMLSSPEDSPSSTDTAYRTPSC